MEHRTGKGVVHFGDTKCPCIGFDNLQGKTMVNLSGDSLVPYPADLGSRCEAWDDGRYPGSCQEGGQPGLGQEWCGQPWCFVDACNCHLDVLPKVSGYLPGAQFRGRPVYYSYSTCGGKDYFTQNMKSWGKPRCRCIGIDGVPGTLNYKIGDGTLEYPAETGGTCQAWDDQRYPDCQGPNPPKWCKQQWCYVDPCDCDLTGKESPKVTAYLPNANFNGRRVFYSYETCGGTDFFTEGNEQACVNQETKDDCKALGDKCGWTGKHCLGKELTDPRLCLHKGPKLPSAPEAEHKSQAVAAVGQIPALLLLMAATSLLNV